MSDEGASKLSKYRDLVIGRKGFRTLLKYEFIILFCSRVPGAAGLWLRSKLYPLLFAECGRNTVFGTNIALRHPDKIKLGDNVIIDDNCLIDAKGRENEGITISNGCFVGRNSILSCKDGNIVLEEGVNIGFNAEIFSGSNVVVGRKTMIAAYCYLIGGGHATDNPDCDLVDQPAVSNGIKVQQDCWLGAGAKILDGVEIGAHSLIGAGAVVNNNIPENSIAAGVPAKVIKNRKKD